MRTLSKSKLLSFRQCGKRLWLELHRPDLRQDSSATQAGFDRGHQVGDIARRLYDPAGKGVLLDPYAVGFDVALKTTTTLLATAKPIFEAGFSAAGALSMADVLLPVGRGAKRSWRMVEVKSSTSVKDYHRDDVAIQAYVARGAGVPLSAIALAYVDSTWTYATAGDYTGLLVEQDMTADAFSRSAEVRDWVAGAQATARKKLEPRVSVGGHCDTPYPCGFIDYCQGQEQQAEFPVQWLPRVQTKALKTLLAQGDVRDLRDVPDELLNQRQLRVKTHSLSRRVYFDAQGAAAALRHCKLPAYFLDFETIQFAVPIWTGTRPYEQLPFQFSVHHMARNGKLRHQAFLDVSGSSPLKAFAETLIAACGEQGPVFVYNAGFETGRIKELAARFPRLRAVLLALNARVVDLMPIAQDYYYHPGQRGSWSIKQVLPAIAPNLRYDALDGVQDGGMAMSGYLEAIAPETTLARKYEIEQQLLAYCALDTMAMVRLWQVFSGRAALSQ